MPTRSTPKLERGCDIQVTALEIIDQFYRRARCCRIVEGFQAKVQIHSPIVLQPPVVIRALQLHSRKFVFQMQSPASRNRQSRAFRETVLVQLIAPAVASAALLPKSKRGLGQKKHQ